MYNKNHDQKEFDRPPPKEHFSFWSNNSMIKFIRFFDRSWLIEKIFSNLDAEPLLVDTGSWAKHS